MVEGGRGDALLTSCATIAGAMARNHSPAIGFGQPRTPHVVRYNCRGDATKSFASARAWITPHSSRRALQLQGRWHEIIRQRLGLDSPALLTSCATNRGGRWHEIIHQRSGLDSPALLTSCATRNRALQGSGRAAGAPLIQCFCREAGSWEVVFPKFFHSFTKCLAITLISAMMRGSFKLFFDRH